MRFQKCPDSRGQRPKSHHICVASHNVDSINQSESRKIYLFGPIEQETESTHEQAKSRIITLKANWFVTLTIKRWK